MPAVSGALLGRNTLLNIGGQALPLIVGVVTIPLLVSGLGTARFGLLSLAWLLLGYFGLLDLGLGRATTRFVSAAIARGDDAAVPRLIWSAVFVQLALGCFGALLLFLATPHLIPGLIRVPAALVPEARAACDLVALGVPIVLVSASFGGALEAAQRFDLLTCIRTPSSLVTYLGPLVGLQLGLGVPGIVAIMLAGRALALCALVLAAFAALPRVRTITPSPAALPQLIRYGSWIMLAGVLGPVLTYADRFMIGGMLGVSQLTYYAAPFDAITRLWIIPSALVATLFPALSALGTSDRERAQRIYRRSLKYLVLATVPALLALIALGKDALQLWLGADFAQHAAVPFQILLAGTLAALIAPLAGNAIQAYDRPQLVPLLYLAYLPLNLVLVWLLVRGWGLSGAALSFAVRAWIETALLLIIAARLVSGRRSLHALREMFPTLGALSLLALAFGAASAIDARVLRIGAVAGGYLLFAGLAWRYLLDAGDRRTVLAALPARRVAVEA